MADGIVLDVLLKGAGTLLGQLAKGGLGAILQVPAITKAIDSTAASFPQLPAAGHTLSRWCESNDFRQILEQVKAGSRDLSQARVVESFIEVGGFFAGEDTRGTAEQVLQTFVLKLEEQLYTTDEALYLHGRRQEVLHGSTHEQLDQMDRRLDAVAGDVRHLLQRQPAPEDRDVPITEQERV